MEKQPNDFWEEKARFLKSEFEQYLHSECAHYKDKSTILSDAFYPLRHNIGLDFWDMLSNEDTMERCRKILESYLANERKQKSAVNNAGTYMSSIKKLKAFIDNKYGGVGKFVKPSDDQQSDGLVANPVLEQPQKGKTGAPSVSPVASVSHPCCEEVQKYLEQWEVSESYYLPENALYKLFSQTYPNNMDINDVLIKVSALNAFYGTNIFSPLQVARHIVNLNIDARLALGDVSLVNDIARVTMNNGTVKNFYSFATKYCSHHKPLEFPIYDSYVDQLLRYFREKDRFFYFRNDDLKNYREFKNILVQFTNYYRLESFSLKEIDKYLWQLGKEKFPKKY